MTEGSIGVSASKLKLANIYPARDNCQICVNPLSGSSVWSQHSGSKVVMDLLILSLDRRIRPVGQLKQDHAICEGTAIGPGQKGNSCSVASWDDWGYYYSSLTTYADGAGKVQWWPNYSNQSFMPNQITHSLHIYMPQLLPDLGRHEGKP